MTPLLVAALIAAQPPHLDGRLLRRMIRAHLSEIRACYDRELERDERAAGRVTLQFAVDGAGRVVAAQVAESTLGRPRAEQCMAAAARAWTFPRTGAPESSLTMVRYPFLLEPPPDAALRAELRLEARACWDWALALGDAGAAEARVTWESDATGFAAVSVEETALPPAAAECLARAAWRHFAGGTMWFRFVALGAE